MHHTRQIRRRRAASGGRTPPALAALAVAALALALTGEPAGAAPGKAAADVVVLGAPGCWPLGTHVEVLRDPTGGLTIADVTRPDVAARFAPDETGLLHLGVTDEVHWVRFAVAARDAAAAQQDWYLSAVRPYARALDVYLPDGGCAAPPCWSARHAGFWDSDGLDRLLSVRLPLDTAAPLVVHARVEPAWHLLLPLEVCTQAAAIEAHQRRMFVQGGLMGVLATMAVLGALLFLALRDRSFLWFVGFELAVLGQFLLEPVFFGGLIGGGPPERLDTVSGALIGLSVFLAVGFARSFLDTRHRAPWIDRGLLGYMAATALVLAAVPFAAPYQVEPFARALGWLAPAVIIVPGAVCWYRGFAPARLYLLAWGLWGVAAVVASLRGDFEPHAPLVFLAGSAVASLLLCIAIADRLRTIRRERAELGVEKARVEAALHETEEKYRSIFQNAQVGLFRIRTEDGIILEANDAMARIFGFDRREDFVGFDMRAAWVSPADRERMYATFAAHKGVLDRFEACFRRRDGEERWCRFSARLVPERGYMEGVGLDIMEERRAAEAIRRSERRFRAVADASRALIFMTDLGIERFLYANPVTLAQFGYRWEELATKRPADLVHPDDVPRFEAMRKDIRPGGGASGLQLRYRTAAGEVRWLDTAGVPLELEEGWVWLVTGLDVTDRYRAERQLMRAEKMAALGLVVAGVAHEINNPNNFIHFNLPILRSYVEAMAPLLDRVAAEEPDLELMGLPYPAFLADVRSMLADMEHGSARITNIVAQLRNYVRGAEPEVQRSVTLSDVVRNVMTLVGKQVSKMVRSLDVTVADDVPPVMGDPGKLEQALINLVVNAGQAADKQDSRIRVEVRRGGLRADDPRVVQIVVEDNGCGIPADVLPRIFDPFFTTKSGDAGTGLGLGIVERIVEEHGGTVDVQSTPGVGSRFTIELPATTVAPSPLTPVGDERPHTVTAIKA